MRSPKTTRKQATPAVAGGWTRNMPESSERENHGDKAVTTPCDQRDLPAGCRHGAASRCSGFALVFVLLFLAILLGGIAVLSSFVTLSQQSGAAQRNAESAQHSALFGLNIALGELQAAAGPDQRVTAPASILGNSTYTGNVQPIAGRTAWTGVWKSNTGTAPNGDPAQFNPATPDTRAFVGWLVSSTDASGNFILPTALAAPTLASTLIADQTRTLFTNDDGSAYIEAGKVQIDDVPGGKRYFAFAVEDEGVKADLSWSETPAAATTTERAQVARLSAAPGPDYGVLNGSGTSVGPFTSVTYPLSIATDPFLTNAIATMRDPADLQGSMSATAGWLKDQRANITWGSKGVLCDVKLGGLRRDLSLAFEMDGTADVSATSQPTKFNQQTGEFVGGNDRLAAPQAAHGMGGVVERFLYRDTQGSGTPFSSSIETATSVVRGPNWWALRDYANLYKRLSGSGGNYTLKARSYYPNVSAKDVNYTLGKATGPSSGANNWDKEINNGKQTSGETYIFRPAKSNYAPVLLGSVCLFSAIATESSGTTAKLGLGIDPFFYLWNPYNRTLKVDKFAIHIRYGFPGHITFYVTQGGIRKQYGPSNPVNYLAVSGTGTTQNRPLTYLVSNLTMAPGEVIVVSPSSSRSASANAFNDEALPGTNTDNASGVILTKIPGTNADNTAISWQEVALNLDTDKVEFTYSNQYQAKNQLNVNTAGTEFFWLHTYLPAPGTTALDLVNTSKLGDELQAIDNNTLGSNAIPEYFYPGQNQVVPPVGPYDARTLENTKNFFGIVSYLAKPASFSGNNPNPVEVFSQFNPAPIGNPYNDLWRPSQLNQIYNMVSRAGGANTLLQECAINFPASPSALNNGFWGQSYSSGSTSLPMSNIPSAPIFSLASFSHAALSVRTAEPYHAVGNSWANLFVSPVSPYGRKFNDGAGLATASDSSWLLNDALFDRYYLSGIAPAFTIGSGGYSATGTIADTLTGFFSANFTSALANPVLRPYLPPSQTATAAIAELSADDGYKKLGAYSLIAGAFNVNSTSVPAWTAFLRANRDLAVNYAQNGGEDGSAGSPFPSSTSPADPGNGAAAFWSGFSRLNDAQVATLAAEIVKQVKLRGPFMSLSDFINHRVGTPKTTESYMGALQAAIEAANINSAVQTGAGGVTPVYSGALSTYFPDPLPIGSRTTTTGIPTDITQANLLLPLAPRLAARSDTFRIRSYGEVRSTDGTKVIAQATCEAIVQRVPEYMDPATDALNNEPWDEGTGLNQKNKAFGRRFKVVSLRWLNSNEI
jgi:hypothetical protein